MIEQILSHLTEFWIILGVLLLFIEVVSPLFGFFLAGGAAFLTSASSALGASVEIQLVVFLVGLFLSLTFVRPKILAKLTSAHHIQSRTEGLMGKTGRVSEPIDPNSGGVGRVTIEGEDWAASGRESLSVGLEVKVVDSDGIILKVEKL